MIRWEKRKLMCTVKSRNDKQTQNFGWPLLHDPPRPNMWKDSAVSFDLTNLNFSSYSLFNIFWVEILRRLLGHIWYYSIQKPYGNQALFSFQARNGGVEILETQIVFELFSHFSACVSISCSRCIEFSTN